MTRCEGCKKEIDPDVCGCGESEANHGYHSGHSFIPMGCDCYRESESPEVGNESPPLGQDGAGGGRTSLPLPPASKPEELPNDHTLYRFRSETYISINPPY